MYKMVAFDTRIPIHKTRLTKYLGHWLHLKYKSFHDVLVYASIFENQLQIMKANPKPKMPIPALTQWITSCQLWPTNGRNWANDKKNWKWLESNCNAFLFVSKVLVMVYSISHCLLFDGNGRGLQICWRKSDKDQKALNHHPLRH